VAATQDVVERVARETGLSKRAARRAVDILLETIRDSLASGEEVRLTGFGTFCVQPTTAGMARDRRPGQRIRGKASKQAAFLPSSKLRATVHNTRPASAAGARIPEPVGPDPTRTPPKRGTDTSQRPTCDDAVGRAATAFAETLRTLRIAESPADIEDPVALGRRAALLASAGRIWRRQFGPLLDVQQAQELLGVGTRQAVHDLAKRQRLLGLPTRGGSSLYPAFQFAADGRPYALLAELLPGFAAAEVDPYTTAAWFTTPQALLDNTTPAEWLRAGRDPAILQEAARRSLARLGQ
jgi:nucleoid DNA-binding protein